MFDIAMPEQLDFAASLGLPAITSPSGIATKERGLIAAQSRCNKEVYIYALIDPRTNEIRYVGKAIDVKQRLQNHLCPRALKRVRHVAQWLSGLMAAGHKPKLDILEIVAPGEDWQIRERYWIAQIGKNGRLTNLTGGGEGGATRGRLGKRNSPDHKAAFGRARRGMPIKQKDPRGLRALGIRLAWERRRINGTASWGKHSQASKELISKKRHENIKNIRSIL